MSCNGLCKQFEKESIKGYDKGQRYCSVCSYYKETDALFCTCCHMMYRRKKRHNKLIRNTR